MSEFWKWVLEKYPDTDVDRVSVYVGYLITIHFTNGAVLTFPSK